jgi:hypothetical protein
MKGLPTFFKSKRGLRQGCPLSPLLYIIMVEALNKELEHERVSGKLQGISFARGVKGINHSQFVDETLLLGGASSIIVEWFKSILDQFLNASEKKVNNGKSPYLWFKYQCPYVASHFQNFKLPLPSILDIL